MYFYVVFHNKLRPRQTSDGLICISLFFPLSPPDPPSDRQQYEPGTGLRLPATLPAAGQRVGLQTHGFRPHALHAPHAGGGGGQLMVVCINPPPLPSIRAAYLHVCLPHFSFFTVCLLEIWPVEIGRPFIHPDESPLRMW